jgi:hypothetical protein
LNVPVVFFEEGVSVESVLDHGDQETEHDNLKIDLVYQLHEGNEVVHEGAIIG